MTVTLANPAPVTNGPLSALWAEITGNCHLREFGRGTSPDPLQACGNCGHHRAAVLPDGTVTPCPLIRWMKAGNVTSTPLADIHGTVTEMAAPQSRSIRQACKPNCLPDSYCNPTCIPGACKPNI